MLSYYTLFKGSDDQFYFNLKAANHEIILQSEGYKSKQGALSGIESVRENSPNDDQYERKVSQNDQLYFVLKAKNGEVIGHSETYTTKNAMENGIKSVKKNAPSAEVKDEKPRKYNIFINKKKYVVEEGSLTGTQILALAGFTPAKYTLFLIKGHDQEQINPDQSVSLKNGMHFHAILSEIPFG